MGQRINLQAIVRPHIVALEKFMPNLPDSIQTRPKIPLDANENALGSCLTSHNPDGASNSVDDDHVSMLHFSNSLDLHRYPSRSMRYLKQQIATAKGLPDSYTERISLGTGSSELIEVLIRLTCAPFEDAILVTSPTYPLYGNRAAVNGVQVIESELNFANNEFRLNTADMVNTLKRNGNIKLIFLASPNNPTASLIPLHQIWQILQSQALKGLLVVDEAYIDFAPNPDKMSALQLLDQFPNLVVLQSLSKAPGLAGIRLGIAYAHEFITEMLQKIQTPFSISSPTAALAIKALSPIHQHSCKAAVAEIIQNREDLIRSLSREAFAAARAGPPLGGSAANFIVLPIWSVDGPKGVRDDGRARRVCEVLEAEHDTAVRYIGSTKGCEGCIRITVGTREENNSLVRNLTTVLRRK
ncbi:Histidinol-phosphate aminotransferase [Cladobotryum mycophilum]|uniref:histidinol-phosphate transaminase n=1 Tax=Cladobotryum mycophilum TaxID=491253 RepID=A0ABR0SRT5_9HYPO